MTIRTDKLEAEIYRLKQWIRRIENINDDPSCFNLEIDEAVRLAWYGRALNGPINNSLPLPPDDEIVQVIPVKGKVLK